MSAPDPHAERDAVVRSWMASARGDLRGARAAARDPDLLPRHACYLAQQAAEKAIKVILLYRGVDFLARARRDRRNLHDLDFLCTLIPDPASWSITREPLRSFLDLARLTVWATEARYPDAAGSEADPDDAATAIATARAVVDGVVADLQREGFALTPPRRPAGQGPAQPESPL